MTLEYDMEYDFERGLEEWNMTVQLEMRGPKVRKTRDVILRLLSEAGDSGMLRASLMTEVEAERRRAALDKRRRGLCRTGMTTAVVEELLRRGLVRAEGAGDREYLYKSMSL